MPSVLINCNRLLINLLERTSFLAGCSLSDIFVRVRTGYPESPDVVHRCDAGGCRAAPNKNGARYRMNGIEAPVHILTHLHPSVSLASLINDIKAGRSIYIKKNTRFPEFFGITGRLGCFSLRKH